MPGENPTRYRRSPVVDETKVGDRLVLYNRDSRKAIVLNATASWMWQLLATVRTLDELARELEARFPSISPELAEKDVSAFVEESLEHGILLPEH